MNESFRRKPGRGSSGGGPGHKKSRPVAEGQQRRGDDRSRSARRGRPKNRQSHQRSGYQEDRIPPRLTPRPLEVDATQPLPAVFVKTRILHPLIFRKRVVRADAAKPGDLVAVYNIEDELLGYGLYNPRSEIAVRVLWHEPQLPTLSDWDEKLAAAVRLRHELLNVRESTNAYRVIHGESDGLSGLVVDRLGDVLSAEAFSLGMYVRGQAILDRLAPLCGTKHTLLQPSPQFLSQEGCQPDSRASSELPSTTTIEEYGTRFRVRFEGGHKTGYFCDQRENRKKLAEFCAGKDVLDLCCYTGGFSVQAAKLGNAAQVTGVDLDHVPLQLARENANLNQVRVKFVQADAFAYMRDMLNNGRQFDVLILDPPKLIRTRQEIEEGTRKHYALNRLAMQLVRPGGVMLSCSCAGLLSEVEFVNLLIGAARRAGTDGGVGRELRMIAKSGAAPDHPVLGNCLETEYLKAVWMVLD